MARMVPSWNRENEGFKVPAYTPEKEETAPESSSVLGDPEKDAVFMGMVRPTPGSKKLVPQYVSKAQAEGAWQNLSKERKEEINRTAKAIDYRGTGKGLFREAVNAAAYSRSRGQNVTPFSYINNLLRDYDPGSMAASAVETGETAGTRRGGGRPAYAGPVSSVVRAAESDIISAADDIAIELLGRGATEQEKEKIVNRIRKAEMAQPQVTTRQGAGMQITQQGLSPQGRQDILREVLSKNPEFEQYQLDTTVMDAMSRFVNKKKAVAGD